MDDEKVVQDRCLTEAFGDAKAKATKLAQLSSRGLGRVIAVTDGSSSPFELKHRSGVEGGVLGGLTIEPGVHTVECGVTVAFELQ
ncbi:MAG: SIMPL domain-containing protein [Acidobacteriota bacterium]